MFTKKEISYMNTLGLNLNFNDLNDLSDDDWINIEEVVATRLENYGFDVNYNPTSEGLMCESILDKIP